MSINFFLGPDFATLAKRYAMATGLRLFWVAINSFMATPFVFVPLPFYRDPLTLWGVVDAVLCLGQLGLLLGLIRLAIRRYRPEIAARSKICDDAFLLRRLGRNRAGGSAMATTILLCGLVVFSCCFVAWLFLGFNYAGANGIGFAPFVRFYGGLPIIIGIVLSILAVMYGTGFVAKAKSQVGSLFGVQYLAADHWLTQRVGAKAAALGMRPPAVGVINVNNAFAIGTRKDAAVVIGVPLAKALTSDELDAVIGHELGHILSNDMHRMQFAEGFQVMLGNVLGVITSVAVRIIARYDRSGAVIGNSLGILARRSVFVGSELVVKGISRSREFHADAIGASVTSPEAMIGALEKLHDLPTKPTRLETQYGYLMFRGARLGLLFSTHPPLQRRVAALRSGSHAFTQASKKT
jgi:heat shock protein HtpX